MFDIREIQQLNLEQKINLTTGLIEQYYKENNGKVYVSFSGGMDSNVLLHLSRQIIPTMKGVFSNTGLEYPEIVTFVSTFENIDIVKPKMRFDEVIKKHGYPVISKSVSMAISRYNTAKDDTQRNLRLYGGTNPTSGKRQTMGTIPKKYHYLLDAPFEISDKCCDRLKKEPLNTYGKLRGVKRILGIMADESNTRMRIAMRDGWHGHDYISPMIFWLRQDVLEYTKEHNLSYCSVYGDIYENAHGDLETTGEHRTGCMFCMFGVHLEKGENRFQRMKRSHPNQYNYCIEKLGCGKVLDYIGVKY